MVMRCIYTPEKDLVAFQIHHFVIVIGYPYNKKVELEVALIHKGLSC
jgi:hypothetical protein